MDFNKTAYSLFFVIYKMELITQFLDFYFLFNGKISKLHENIISIAQAIAKNDRVREKFEYTKCNANGIEKY